MLHRDDVSHSAPAGTEVHRYLEAEAELESDVRPAAAGAAPEIPPREVLLTGATGYLGAYLLADLIARTEARIFCLVRAEDNADARRRLSAVLAGYALFDSIDSGRVVPVAGDLTAERLGLSNADYAWTSEKLDAIYHNGAWVNHSHDYAMLRAANVGGTRAVLRLCCEGRAKTLHFVSTLSVLSARAYEDCDVIWEEAPLRPLADTSSGYVESKWVAERLVRGAAARGVPAVIYRPSLVGSHGATGRIVSNDYYYPQFLRACILTACFPEEYLSSESNVVPVDFVSRAISAISSLPVAPEKGTFHLRHPEPLRGGDTFAVLRELGYALEPLPLEVWARRLKRYLRAGMDTQLMKLYPVFAAEAARRTRRAGQGIVEPLMPVFGARNTDAVLSAVGLGCPPAVAAFRTMCEYLIENAIIPPPPGHHLSALV